MLELLVVEHTNGFGDQPELNLFRRGSELERSRVASAPPSPERLRIRSRRLIAHLERITGKNISGQFSVRPNRINHKTAQSGVTFLRPFKLFVEYENEIRQSFGELEALVRRDEEEASDSGDSSSSDDSASAADEEVSENQCLLGDLRCLMEFMDVDLQPTLELRRRIRDGTATDIEYADLWHLFERGDFVVAGSNREHAYRVVNYTGGRAPLIDRLENEDSEVRILDGFTIDCYSLGFNGSEYGSELTIFPIRKFFGRQPITSLPVYPLRFDTNRDALYEGFREQGRRFLDLTLPPFFHKTMEGSTLDQPSHEIEGQVIIDQRQAINAKPEWEPQMRIYDDDLTTADERETSESPHCHHNRFSEGCCGSDVIFKDLDMDQLRASTFIRENVRLLGPRTAKELTEEEYILLPHWIYAFVLRSRQWVKLRTADLSDVKFENDFEELILPEKHKRTVQALVRTHENFSTRLSSGFTSVGAALDFVKGKGTGLIILPPRRTG